MQLESFSVSGFRSLADVDTIPVRAPTILTGANDGGKTALLKALSFLLGGSPPQDKDRTLAREGDPPEAIRDGRFLEVVVVGQFMLASHEQESLGLSDEVLIRRCARMGEPSRFEYRANVPSDARLRGLDATMSFVALKERAASLGVDPVGPGNAKASYLEPLLQLARGAPTISEWTPAPRELVERLPRIIEFASTEEPDPEQDIRNSLRTVYQALVDDPNMVGPVRRVERKIQERLQSQATALQAHLRLRCPELADIQVIPSVSFKEGFGGVELLAGTDAATGIGLKESGAGRRRRVTLAVWEWTTDLLSAPEPTDRNLVLAYDEPDTHLDYQRQREFVDLIRSQAELPGVKIVVATHSLNLIDKVAIEDVVHVRLVDERSVVDRLIGDQHTDINRYLGDIAAEMGLRNSVLLHERCFVAVEGPTEAQVFPILFRLATGLSLQSAGLALIVGNNNDGALKVARFLNDHGRSVHFVIDADSATASGTRRVFRPESLTAQGISADQMHLIGDPRELEDLFSDAQWADTANRDWPRVDLRAWVPEDVAPLRGEVSFSKGLNRLVRNESAEAPTGKPGYALALARGLHSAEEIPIQLRDVFKQLFDVVNAP